ncbi:hypothetical protein [Brevundimonas subvibrioides]|uniref:hypothetical protein n=1 Tax=Brevundimonas subvibrioides TaxID=74313 RepID=UPI0022B39F63|nr:hypothetical protein [Brevundimonas subvibrioides]
MASILSLALIPAGVANAQTVQAAFAKGGRVSVVYDGGMSGTLTVQDRRNGAQLQLGGINLNLAGSRQIPISGGYHAEVVYDGSTVRGTDALTSNSDVFTGGTSTFYGTRSGEVCDIVDNFGHQFRATCSLTRFEYEQDDSGPGSRTVMRLAAVATSAVDLVEQDRINQQAQLAAQRQREAEQAMAAQEEAAFQAMLASRPAASRSQTTALEQAIAQDSQSWLFNRFDPGSVNSVVVMPASNDGLVTVRGNYSFNGGAPGWVEARLQAGVVQCVVYWDFQDSCRPVMSAPAPRDQASGETSTAYQSQREAEQEFYRRQTEEEIANTYNRRNNIYNSPE